MNHANIIQKPAAGRDAAVHGRDFGGACGCSRSSGRANRSSARDCRTATTDPGAAVGTDEHGPAGGSAVHGGRQRHRGECRHPVYAVQQSRGQCVLVRPQFRWHRRHGGRSEADERNGQRHHHRQCQASGGHRPGRRVRAGPFRAGFFNHPHRAVPGRTGAGNPTVVRQDVGQSAGGGRTQHEPGSRAGHRTQCRVCTLQPADRLLRTGVWLHAANRFQSWQRFCRRHAAGRHCSHRQAFSRTRQGDAKYGHQRQRSRPDHHAHRSLPATVSGCHQPRCPGGYGLQRILRPD